MVHEYDSGVGITQFTIEATWYSPARFEKVVNTITRPAQKWAYGVEYGIRNYPALTDTHHPHLGRAKNPYLILRLLGLQIGIAWLWQIRPAKVMMRTINPEREYTGDDGNAAYRFLTSVAEMDCSSWPTVHFNHGGYRWVCTQQGLHWNVKVCT